MHLLPDNPNQFDYLHAIRAIASRSGDKKIFDLADAAMQMGDQSSSLESARKLCRWAFPRLQEHAARSQRLDTLEECRSQMTAHPEIFGEQPPQTRVK